MTGAVALPGPAVDRRAIAVLLLSCSIWGLMWWPLKAFGAQGLSGPWLTLLAYGAVSLVALPWLWREWPAWRVQTAAVVGLVVVGGWANASFVQALLQGEVVRVMLLFYLSPVWAVLGGALFLGETVGARRAAAVALAVAGAFLVIGGTRAFDAPLSVADALALGAGLAFAGNNLIARGAQRVPLATKSVTVWLGCAAWSAAWIFWGGNATWPTLDAPLAALVAGFGLLWIGLATLTWQYGVTRLEAGRAGVILITELVVAVLSAVALGAQVLTPAEWAGAALIGAAALLEALSPSSPTPERKAAAA